MADMFTIDAPLIVFVDGHLGHHGKLVVCQLASNCLQKWQTLLSGLWFVAS